MKLLLLSVLCFCFQQNTFSQRLIKDSSAFKKLIMVDSFATDLKSMIISPDKIKRVTLLENNTALCLFGEKAKEGAILFTLKENTHLMRLNEILTAFNFPDSEKNLRVCINDVIVDKPGLIIADLDNIASIGTFYSVDVNCLTGVKDEKMINIVPRNR